MSIHRFKNPIKSQAVFKKKKSTSSHVRVKLPLKSKTPYKEKSQKQPEKEDTLPHNRLLNTMV